MANEQDSTVLYRFLTAATRWAHEHDDIVGLALIGSHARGEARPDSDIDLSMLCKTPGLLIDNQDWTARFGNVLQVTVEPYGPTRSVRVFYDAGPEVEFGIAGPSWASLPLDSGTQRVVSDGIQILYDPLNLFTEARNAAIDSSG